jgi:hypothetical protein
VEVAVFVGLSVAVGLGDCVGTAKGRGVQAHRQEKRIANTLKVQARVFGAIRDINRSP